MKQLVWIVAIAVIGCGNKGGDQESAAAPPRPPCRVHVEIHEERLVFEGDLNGEISGQPGYVWNLSALKPPRPHCAASIWADDRIPYRELLRMLGAMHDNGFIDLALLQANEKPVPPPTGTQFMVKGTNGVDGEHAFVGYLDPARDTYNIPVVKLSKTWVEVVSTRVAKIGDSDMDVAIAKGLEHVPGARAEDPTILIAADPDLPFSAIKTALAGVKLVGYTNFVLVVAQ